MSTGRALLILLSVVAARAPIADSLAVATAELATDGNDVGRFSAPCPEHWHLVDNFCYFVPQFILVVDWHTANVVCDGMQPKATLATTNTSVINDFIHDLVYDMGWQGAWLGLDRREDGSSWVWNNGRPVTVTHWAPDYPTQSGDCGAMDKDGLWVNHNCTDAIGLPPACQYLPAAE